MYAVFLHEIQAHFLCNIEYGHSQEQNLQYKKVSKNSLGHVESGMKFEWLHFYCLTILLWLWRSDRYATENGTSKCPDQLLHSKLKERTHWMHALFIFFRADMNLLLSFSFLWQKIHRKIKKLLSLLPITPNRIRFNKSQFLWNTTPDTPVF